MVSLFKEVRYENPRLTEAANGEACTNCRARDGTVVAAHSNELRQRGMGLKGHDCFVAYLCFACHDYVDGRAKSEPTGLWGDNVEDRRECHRRAREATLLLWARRGWLKVSG